MKFTNTDVADYYSQTLIHYQTWWNVSDVLAVHYGIWEPGIRSFEQALINTNQKLAVFAQVAPNDLVLDAGCGVGGTSLFLAREVGCQVRGITLSQKQLDVANQAKNSRPEGSAVEFSLQDYTQTDFESDSFDAIIACESVCHANHKEAFLSEAWRLLKPGGRLVVCDFFLTPEGQKDENQYIQKWGETWAVSQYNIKGDFEEKMARAGFQVIQQKNFTNEILPSARRMYYAYLLGAIPSKLYNLTHQTSRFAKTHYLSGKYQYLSLKKKQLEYWLMSAVKN